MLTEVILELTGKDCVPGCFGVDGGDFGADEKGLCAEGERLGAAWRMRC